MKVLGVVLELNPFHNGHKYFLSKAQEEIKPDITIAIMSGNFSMRGEVMVMDKWTRAQLLLQHNVDIVLELPYLSTVNSADYFSYNAINTLCQFRINNIAFGVELDDLYKLQKIKAIIDSDIYQESIKKYLSKGLSYSASSYKAIQEITNEEDIIKNCTLPNNTLAIGYLKAIEELNPIINPTLIKRIDNNYYDEDITHDKINSATALRRLIAEGIDISKYTPDINYNYFHPQKTNENLLFLLKYLFSVFKSKDFTNIYGVSEGIENRINSFIHDAQSFDDLIKNIKTKRYPPNRIKRLLLHILLQTPKEYENKYHHYLRILSMNEKGVNYLNSLPKEIKKQIITSFKNQDHYLVDMELKASKLYSLLVGVPNLYLKEFNVPYLGGKQ